MNDNFQYQILPDDYPQHDLNFKLIVIGDSGVGKSSLTLQAIKNIYEPYDSPTIGFQFFTLNIKLNEVIIKLQIWDTCGQELYRSLVANFYRNASLAIMVYSIENYESFANVDTWYKDVKTISSPDVKIFLIGNKIDLEEKRKVDKSEAEQYQTEHGLDFFIEASAKTGFNAQNVFIEAAKCLYIDQVKYKERLSQNSSIESGIPPFNPNIHLPKPESNDSKRKCC